MRRMRTTSFGISSFVVHGAAKIPPQYMSDTIRPYSVIVPRSGCSTFTCIVSMCSTSPAALPRSSPRCLSFVVCLLSGVRVIVPSLQAAHAFTAA